MQCVSWQPAINSCFDLQNKYFKPENLNFKDPLIEKPGSATGAWQIKGSVILVWIIETLVQLLHGH